MDACAFFKINVVSLSQFKAKGYNNATSKNFIFQFP